MPPIFKALATITVWILFINGVGSLAYSVVDTLVRTGGIGGEPYKFSDAAWWAVTIVSLFFAVAAMKIRKELE